MTPFRTRSRAMRDCLFSLSFFKRVISEANGFSQRRSASSFSLWGCTTPPSSGHQSMISKTIDIDGIKVFYREAGTPGSPKLVLLHGFPASSHQYRNLMPALAERFHIVAPDYPGFGNSDMARVAHHSERQCV